jgi:hypothetical protein
VHILTNLTAKDVIEHQCRYLLPGDSAFPIHENLRSLYCTAEALQPSGHAFLICASPSPNCVHREHFWDFEVHVAWPHRAEEQYKITADDTERPQAML